MATQLLKPDTALGSIRTHSQMITVGPRQITGWFVQIVSGIDVFLHDLGFRMIRLVGQDLESPQVISHILA